MKTLIVKVTQEHINTGSKHSCFDCPIAYAIIEAYSMPKKYENYYYRKISVAKTIKLDSHFNVAEIPKAMVKWIVDFDNGKPVKPFEFTLNLPANPNVPVITDITLSKIK